jgi:hypothetical protein
VSHFRAFGCRCFILKKGRLDKFESRSSDGIFLGYASHSRAFRVLNLDTNLVMETCEVTFDETQPCNSSVLGNSGKHITLETSKSNGILEVCFSGAGNSRIQEV